MPDQKAIEDQLELLNAYRRTLMQYLKQRAVIGMVHIQPGVALGIYETRANIRRIKNILQSWGVDVEDWPDDEEAPEEKPKKPIGALTPSTTATWLSYWPMAIAAAALVIAVFIVIRPGRNDNNQTSITADSTSTSSVVPVSPAPLTTTSIASSPESVPPSTVTSPTAVLLTNTLITDTLPSVSSLFEKPLHSDEIGIVVHVDLTGKGAVRGRETLDSATFEIEQRIATLPESLRKRVVVRYVDDSGDETRAATVAEQVAQQQNVMCVMGLNRSTTALKALVAYDKARIPTISVSATNAKLTTSDEYPNRVFRRMVATDAEHGIFAADEIRSRNPRKLAILYVADPYGTALSAAVTNELNIRKFPVSNPIPLPRDLTDIDIAKIVKSIDLSTDLVFFAGYYDQAVKLFPAIRKAIQNIQFFGSDGIDNAEMLKAWPDIKGMIYTGIAAPIQQKEPVTRQKFPDLVALAQRYEESRPRSIAPTYLGESYDAMGLCLKLVEYAEQELGGVSQEHMYQALGMLTAPGKKVMGVAGPYEFTADGNLKNPVYYIRSATDNWADNPIEPHGNRE